MDWQQNGLLYGSTNLDNRMSENVKKKNDWQNYKLPYENHVKLERGIRSIKTNPSGGKILKRRTGWKGLKHITWLGKKGYLLGIVQEIKI